MGHGIVTSTVKKRCQLYPADLDTGVHSHEASPKLAGWFIYISWKIRKSNGWWTGVPPCQEPPIWYIYILSYRSYFILLISVTWAILEVGAAPVVIFATLDTPKFRNFLAQEFKLMNHCHYIYTPYVNGNDNDIAISVMFQKWGCSIFIIICMSTWKPETYEFIVASNIDSSLDTINDWTPRGFAIAQKSTK